MAGQAQKKAAKAAASSSSFYGALVFIVNAVYCLWLAGQASQGTDKWQALQAWSLARKLAVGGGAAFCYWYAYSGLVTAARHGTSTSTYVDLLGLTMLAQLASVFWHGAWLLLLVVPILGVGSYLMPLLGLFKGGGAGGAGAEGSAADAAAEAKRQAKKERKANKMKIIR